MDLELAKDLYKFEWELRMSLTRWLQVPIASVTVIGAILGYVLKDQTHLPPSTLQLFYLFVVGSILAWVYATVCICRSFFGYTYEKLPKLSSLSRYKTDLQSYFQTYPCSDNDADAEFERYIVRRMAEATDVNSVNNVTKSHWLNQASAFTIMSLALLALATAIKLL